MTASWKGEFLSSAASFPDHVIQQIIGTHPRYTFEDVESPADGPSAAAFHSLFEAFDGDPIDLKNQLCELFQATPILLQEYLPIFVDSGLPWALVANLSRADLDVQILILHILTNLSSKPSVCEYTEALINAGVLNQFKFHLRSRGSSEIVFAVLCALSNYAQTSASIRDRILEELSLDLFVFLAQSKELDEGGHNELLDFFVSLLMEDLEEEQAVAVIESVSMFGADFLDAKRAKMLRIGLLLSQYDVFYERFSELGIIAKFVEIFVSDDRIKILRLLFGIFLSVMRFQPEPLVEIVPHLIDFLDSQAMLVYGSVLLLGEFVKCLDEKQALAVIDKLRISFPIAQFELRLWIARCLVRTLDALPDSAMDLVFDNSFADLLRVVIDMEDRQITESGLGLITRVLAMRGPHDALHAVLAEFEEFDPDS
jgi:hypothetical protein